MAAASCCFRSSFSLELRTGGKAIDLKGRLVLVRLLGDWRLLFPRGTPLLQVLEAAF